MKLERQANGFLIMLPMSGNDWATNTLAPRMRMMGARVDKYDGRPHSRAQLVVLLAMWETQATWQAFRTGPKHGELMSMLGPKIKKEGLVVLDWVATWYPQADSDVDTFLGMGY